MTTNWSNTAPPVHGNTVTKTVAKPNYSPISAVSNLFKQTVGYIPGTTPKLPPVATPRHVNTKAIINSLPSITSIYHG